MAEIPPSPNDPGYGSYYRGNAPAYGSSEQLRLLTSGYFGLNTAFLINVAMNVGFNVYSRTLPESQFWSTFFIVMLVMFVVIAAMTFPHNKKIADGLGWPSWGGPVASILMGLNSALCCGIIGYIVMQSLAAKEVKKYGLKPSFFGGLKKNEVNAMIESLQAQGR